MCHLHRSNTHTTVTALLPVVLHTAYQTSS
nr:MAG TPA: hypothetical protein [Caudoviricetes sp.]DAO05265.1 MAG TPA: hypothetical protein [Caudoviricetes sp.]